MIGLAAASERRARSLLRAHPSGRLLAAGQFTPITGGEFNRSWRVDAAERSCFVRLAHDDARELGADWRSEAALLAIASRAGLAPSPVIVDPDSGLLVTEFVAGCALTSEQSPDTAQLARIAQLLRELHALSPDPAIRPLAFDVQARHLERGLGPLAAADSALYVHAANVFARLAKSAARAVPCHNDVHRRNLIDDGRRLWLVDWEYGGIGDPAFDVAGCISHFALDTPQVELLLDAYGDGIDRARLPDACWAYDYVQWLWYRVAAQQPGRTDKDRLAVFAHGLAARLRERA